MKGWIHAIVIGLQEIIPPEWIALLISILPIFELRGGLIAARLMGVDPWVAFLFCFVGNMLPVPFIVLFFRKLLRLLQRRSGVLQHFGNWLEARTERNRSKVERFEVIGLLLLVAIPLPGTGAWTGACLASLLDIRLRRAVPIIAAGVAIAGGIMLGVSYWLPSLFF